MTKDDIIQCALFDALKRQDEVSVAAVLHEIHRYDFVYVNDIWYERVEGQYQMKGKTPKALHLTLRQGIPNLLSTSEISTQQTSLKLKRDLQERQLDVKDEWLACQESLARIERLQARLGSSCFLARVLNEAKISFSVDLNKEQLSSLLVSVCPIEQWAILCLMPSMQRYTPIASILSRLHTQLVDVHVTATKLGRVLRLIFGDGSKTINGVRQYRVVFRC